MEISFIEFKRTPKEKYCNKYLRCDMRQLFRFFFFFVRCFVHFDFRDVASYETVQTSFRIFDIIIRY